MEAERESTAGLRQGPPGHGRWRKRHAAGIALGLCLAVALGGGIAAARFLAPYKARADKVDLGQLDDYDVSTIFYDRDGGEIGRIFIENRVLLDDKTVPPIVRDAIVAAEDRRFYHHHGVDWRGLFRAGAADFRRHKVVQGGSTLTQQLAKHLINNFSRTFDRKIYETFVARRIEHRYTKEQILRYYLNRVYFGSGYFGVEAAAEGYFGVHARELNPGQAALLMGIVRSPNRNNPRVDPARALIRRDWVIDTMRKMGTITAAQAREARAQKLALTSERHAGAGPDDYYVAAIRRELDQVLGDSDNDEMPQGLKVITTIDPGLQREATRISGAFLSQLESRLPAGKPGAAPLESASVLIDAKTGGIRAMIGGRDFKRSQFDRLAMAHRETGALLQPFLYAVAFDAIGLNPATLLNAGYLDLQSANKAPKPEALDTPLTAPDGRFVTLQDALDIGSPFAAARVELRLGPPVFADWLAEALDRPVPERDRPSWKRESPTLLETASLYQMLAADGRRLPPHFIEKIVSRQGAVLFNRAAPETAAPLTPLTARQIALTLAPATQEGASRALTDEYHFPFPVVGMAGYSPGYRDAAFAGFAAGMVGATWIGYDDSRPLGPPSQAAETALPLWNALMRAAIDGNGASAAEALPVPIPPELRKYEVDRRTGVLLGPGHLTPAPGDTFVYLTPRQAGTVPQNGQVAVPAVAADGSAPPAPAFAPAPAAAANPGGDWADWLGTLLAGDPNAPAAVAAATRDTLIPRVAEYRLPALRGAILSAEGTPLAATVQSQSLVLPWPGTDVVADATAAVAWAKPQIAKAAEWLQQPVELSDARLRDLYTYQRFQPITVAEDLLPEQVAAFPKSELPALHFTLQGVPLRSYPRGYLAAHALGYLRRIQARNTGRYQGGEVMYGDYAGASGIEEAFDEKLRGTEGKLVLRTNPAGFTESAAVTARATTGHNVRTTLRLPLQEIVERALSSVSAGAVVIIDVKTGDVVALASRPTFDPNEFIPVLSADAWHRMADGKLAPLLDRATSEEQPPGSTFKIITSLAAMRAKVLDPDAVFETNGIFDVGNIEYKIPDEAGRWNYQSAMSHSINVYFFNLGLKVGRDMLLATARALGMGQPTGFALGEAPGRMPDNAFVLAAHQRSFGPGDVTNTSIGQGDVLETPIQMARLAEIVANEGTSYVPRIVSAVEEADGKVVEAFPPQPAIHFDAAPGDWKLLKDALQAVTDDGTGRAAQPKGIRLSGKTGTAQVGSKAAPREILWFMGYVPSNQPEYAFAVMVEGKPKEDLYAATTAAPLVARIFGELYHNQAKAAKEGTETVRRAEPVEVEALPPVAEPIAAPAKADADDADTDDDEATAPRAEPVTP
jgi:penicillin-binding protein 2